MVLKYEHLGK